MPFWSSNFGECETVCTDWSRMILAWRVPTQCAVILTKHQSELCMHHVLLRSHIHMIAGQLYTYSHSESNIPKKTSLLPRYPLWEVVRVLWIRFISSGTCALVPRARTLANSFSGCCWFSEVRYRTFYLEKVSGVWDRYHTRLQWWLHPLGHPWRIDGSRVA